MAGGEVGEGVEIRTLLGRPSPPPVRSLRDSSRTRSLRWARMCYDHLAGVVGMAVTEALLAQGALCGADGGLGLGPDGHDTFAREGISAGDPHRAGPPLVRPGMHR